MKNMTNNVFRKGLVIGIIVFFVGAGVTPVISENTIKNTNVDDAQNYEFVPGEFIVKLTNNGEISSPSIKVLNEKHQVNCIERVFKNSDNAILNNIYIFSVPEDADLISIVDDYSSCPDVEYAEPNGIFYLFGIPNDENFCKQWALQNTGQNGGTFDADIDAPEAWDIGTGSSDVTIAIIDSGVDYTHPDLANNIWINEDEIPNNGVDDDNNGFIDDIRSWDFCNDDNDPLDDSGHGTHCAGIASAIGNNSIGIAGVCWNCKIMPVKGFDKNGVGWATDLANAIIYATDNGADVISMSWGNYNSTKIIHDAVDYAYSNGVVLVAAAGNILIDISRKFYPAAFDNVIAVAATDKNDYKASFSNYGEWVDVAAPGEEIYSTMPTYYVELNSAPYFLSMNYDYLDGTSMACPMVAGLAGLLLSYNPNLTPDEVRNIIHDSTDWINTDKYIGNGRINAYKALLIESGITVPPNKPTIDGPAKGQTGTIYNYTATTTDPDADELYFLFSWGDGTYSGWVGPFASGAVGSANHTWSNMGSFKIKVKARDSYCVESDWSDPLSVTMPKNKAYINTPFLNFLEEHPNLFLIIQKIIQRLGLQ
jgi:subtilisin family serine protease